MLVGSLFSGIGGLDLGLHRAGWDHAFFCESDSYRRDVLRARWPGVPVYDDVRAAGEPAGRAAADGRGAPVDLGRWEAGTGLLCGGFPCQDVSVAGRRKGLAGERSGLFHEFARIAESLRPRWLLVENVPGLLSSNGGRDFGVVLGTLADLGYGVAWRILDSRYFGVPQRRRRVFIVGALAVGDPRAAAERAGEILAVGSRCDRHSQKGGETRSESPVASLSGLGSGGPDDNDGQGGRLIADTLRANGATGGRTDKQPMVIADTVRSHPRPGSNSDGNIVVSPRMFGSSRGGANALRPGFTGDEHIVVSDGAGPASRPSAAEGLHVPPSVAAPLSHGSNPNSNMGGRRREDDENLVVARALTPPQPGKGDSYRLDDQENLVAVHMLQDPISDLNITPAWGKGTKTGSASSAVANAAGVRRLTPTECERLQALPDGWTQLGGTADSKRYAALGDAVTASVAEWIGRRILEVS